LSTDRAAATGTVDSGEPQARIRELAEFLWEQSPGHFDGALSKILVSAQTGARYLDFRISSYAPKAYVQRHVHEAKEQIYYFLEGEGLLELGSRREVVRPQQFVFIPAGVPHALFNTGLGNLVFLVITTPTQR
jgi:mannose-6-phosphate isomerase-like protein (cupin superfamily)